MRCRGLHGLANSPYPKRFLFPGLPRVAGLCARGTVLYRPDYCQNYCQRLFHQRGLMGVAVPSPSISKGAATLGLEFMSKWVEKPAQK
jgi:hypothetical protein